MARRVKVTISATGIPQFRRLVDFLRAVSDYADVTADEDLKALVADCERDLREGRAEP